MIYTKVLYCSWPTLLASPQRAFSYKTIQVLAVGIPHAEAMT